MTWVAAVLEAAVNVVRVAGVELPTEIDKVLACFIAIGLRGAIGKK